MDKVFRSVAAPLMMALSLAGCESQADLDRKPDVAETLIKDSLETCNVESPAIYKERLRDILMDVRATRLDTLKDHYISVCLDKRLSTQTNGFADKRIDGIFYPEALSGKEGSPLRSVVSLWDNGKAIKDDGFLDLNASDHGAEIVIELARQINSKGMPHAGEIKIAGQYSYRCGKSRCHEARWKAGEHFDQDSVRKNPQLATPPTPAQW